jgi:hypothetical protein
VVDELELAPTLPGDPTAARWELVRWWCQLVVDGHLRPEVGGRLLWLDGWIELDYPQALRPLVGWVSEWDDWDTSWGVPRDTYAQHHHRPHPRRDQPASDHAAVLAHLTL